VRPMLRSCRSILAVALVLVVSACGNTATTGNQLRGYVGQDQTSVSFLQLVRTGDELSGTDNVTDFQGSGGPFTSSVAISGHQQGDAVTLMFGQQSVSGSFTTGSTLLLGMSDPVLGFHTLRLHPGTAADYQSAVARLAQWNQHPVGPPPSSS